jgi:DNA-binding MarR family transcriptional regulator
MALSESYELSCNAASIRKASRRITQFYDGVLEPSGLRSTQFTILKHVIRTTDDEMTKTQLADTLVIERSAIGHNLQPLIRDGLIVVKPSAFDRRRDNIVATKRGIERFREATKLWRKAQDHVEARLGTSRAAQMRKLMLSVASMELELPTT